MLFLLLHFLTLLYSQPAQAGCFLNRYLAMKKAILIFFLCFLLLQSFAQSPDDILKYSYFPQHGSARNVAIGGAMGSLGGDITSMYVNPAGLGLYKTSEVVISPAFQFNNNKAAFRGTDLSSNKTAFDLGLTGAVFGSQNQYSKNKSEAFGIAVNQTANFNNTITYSGQNNLSSYSEQFAEEIAKNGYSLNDLLSNASPAPFGSSPAFYTYLVDTTTVNGQTIIKGTPESILDAGGALNQTKTVKTNGGIYEVALSYAANTNDKFYYGFTLGIPIVSYRRNNFFREQSATNDATSDFAYSEWNDQLKTNGYGLNAKLGLLYKPTNFVRLGLAIHTPTYYTLTDKESSNMTTAFKNPDTALSVSSATFTDGGVGSTRYITNTPWRFIVSGSYVLHEVNDVSRQRGFITADAEYVTYGSARYKSDGHLEESSDDAYFTNVNSVIKNYYKGAFNFRVGGEVKFNTIAVRLGGAYYGNPYRDAALSSSITQVSGGLGYRSKGIFIDLTYAEYFNKDVNFPYRLQDKANTFATYKNNRGNVLLSVGFKI